MNTLNYELKVAESRFQTAIQKIANKYFRDYVKPYCDKHDLEFLAGMGTWVFYTRTGARFDLNIQNSITQKKLHDILNTSIDGMDGNDLGSLMPDYRFSDRNQK